MKKVEETYKVIIEEKDSRLKELQKKLENERNALADTQKELKEVEKQLQSSLIDVQGYKEKLELQQ